MANAPKNPNTLGAFTMSTQISISRTSSPTFETVAALDSIRALAPSTELASCLAFVASQSPRAKRQSAIRQLVITSAIAIELAR